MSAIGSHVGRQNICLAAREHETKKSCIVLRIKVAAFEVITNHNKEFVSVSKDGVDIKKRFYVDSN